jgi:hypothetical protein
MYVVSSLVLKQMICNRSEIFVYKCFILGQFIFFMLPYFYSFYLILIYFI